MEEDIMILEEKKAIDDLFSLTHINGYIDLDKLKKATIYTSDLKKWQNGVKVLLNIRENLIKGYRELEYKYNKALTDLSIEAKRTNEENYRCSLFAVENNDLKEKLADSIPKSKIKEKLEELEHEKFKRAYLGLFPKNNCENRILLAKIQVLQELIEEDK